MQHLTCSCMWELSNHVQECDQGSLHVNTAKMAEKGKSTKKINVVEEVRGMWKHLMHNQDVDYILDANYH